MGVRLILGATVGNEMVGGRVGRPDAVSETEGAGGKGLWPNAAEGEAMNGTAAAVAAGMAG